MSNGVFPSFSSLRKILSRPSPFSNETGQLANGYYDPSENLINKIQNQAMILILGAGGLGCELLKNLALSGFKHIHVIDMDTIDITNLNRQFLFRAKDVGSPKAVVAAEFVMKRVPGCQIVPHFNKLQDFDENFFRQFNIVLSGLDNVDARRWMNFMLASIVRRDAEGNIDISTLIPFIDGGTEGMKGQVRLILPLITSCFECSLDTIPPQQTFQICTIASTPRQPAHCIAYALIIQFPEHHTHKPDFDNPEDVDWIYRRAEDRARQFGIEGVTYSNTLGVAKNIIPAVASMNAAISGLQALEVLKLHTFCSQSLNTYAMFMAGNGCYCNTFEYQKNEECCVCKAFEEGTFIQKSFDAKMTLGAVVNQLKATHKLRSPSFATSAKSLYFTKPVAMEESTKPNLSKPLDELLSNGDVITITDDMIPTELSINIQIELTN